MLCTLAAVDDEEEGEDEEAPKELSRKLPVPKKRRQGTVMSSTISSGPAVAAMSEEWQKAKSVCAGRRAQRRSVKCRSRRS